jgi:hypothetical protein
MCERLWTLPVGPDPRQPAAAGKSKPSSPNRQEDIFISADRNDDEHSEDAVPNPDVGQVSIPKQQPPRRRFRPWVIKGGLTPASEISGVDRIKERLIRLGVRPGGPTFPEVMRQISREQFPWIGEETTLDSIEKYHS